MATISTVAAQAGTSPEQMAEPSGPVWTFLAATLIGAVAFGYTVFMSLPSNVLYGQDDGLRLSTDILVSQQFPFFTKNPQSESVNAYRTTGDDTPESLMITPQGRAQNLFGISRLQRAQGPELAFLANETTVVWHTCSGTADECVRRAAAWPAQRFDSPSPLPTVCGDAFLTVERPVPFAYRKLVSYRFRTSKVAHVNVTCPR